MVIDHEIAETVIHVDRRMSYTSVTKILEDEDLAEMQEYEELGADGSSVCWNCQRF